MTELCRTYEQGYVTGEEAAKRKDEVELSSAEMASLPARDGTLEGALRRDAAVARILCARKAVDYSKNDPLGVNLPEYREAFVYGCTDGAAPGGLGKVSRDKYEGPAPS
ncbi:hypothetical protein ACFT25_15860 [Streptomyces hydrogenans]|uniref:hypothetical protein n=1 Tax=Streptomyces hydrogenans TaxID=1873719 RepID=UPI00362DE095